MIPNYLSSIILSHGAVFSREHIGSVFYLISTSSSSNKIFVIKHSHLLVSLLSNNCNAPLHNTLFHIFRTASFYSNMSSLCVSEISTDYNVRYLEKTLLLEYGFFSQVEWRYLRFNLLQLWFSSTVIHSRFYDFNLRNYASFLNLFNMRHGTFLVLSSKFKNISTSSFLTGVFYLSTFLSRSRTDENTYEDDFYSYEEELQAEPILDTCSYIGNDSNSVDVDFDAHYSVEEQCNISGFFFDNNLCSISSFDVYMSFSYINLYEHMLHFYSRIQLYFFYINIFYFFFFSFYIYVQSTMLFKNVVTFTFSYFFSDYLF